MMGSRTLALLFRFCLVVSLLAGLFLSSVSQPAAAAHPVGEALKDSPAAPAYSSAGPASPVSLVPQAASGLDLISIPAVPVGTPAPAVDGFCGQSEYAAGSGYSFIDARGFSATVSLIHDASYLYVCMVGIKGLNATRFASLYLDPQGNGASYTYAQQDDFALHEPIPGGAADRSSWNGTGSGNYFKVSPAPIDIGWTAMATVDDKNGYDFAEYRLELMNFGIDTPCAIFNLGLYHHWVDLPNGASDFGWPSNQWYDQPRTWQPAMLGGTGCSGVSGKVAYVFRGDTAAAASFYNLLTAAGYSVTLVPLSSVLATDFSTFDLILIADDTGSLDQWGTPGQTASQVSKIADPSPGRAGKPIIGLGEGGYAFFGRLSLYIGWPQGWHGPQNKINRAALPNVFFAAVYTADPVPYYTAPTNSVGIYTLPKPLPLGVTVFGNENPLDDHASLILQGCRMLWGNSGTPYSMTGDGTLIFLNTVQYMRTFQCPNPPAPPPPDCLTIIKSASPDPSAGLVPVGGSILYTLTYQIKPNTGCPTSARLEDVVPSGTSFVANSATDGISPGPDGSLVWIVTPSAGPLTKQFKVIVTEEPCTNIQMVSNFAGLRPDPLSPGSPFTPLPSDPVVHHIQCPAIGLPNQGPVFAEDELQIHPYPLLAGATSQVSVRVINLTGVSQVVSASFQQASPQGLGIGLNYVTFAKSTAALPANGTAVLTSNYVPALSGNQCIQALVSTPEMVTPLVTQRCLDVTEDLQPGVTDHLSVPVRNNTAGSAAISLVVDNTCPGWTASVTPAITAVLGPGASQTVDFSVTPPATTLLGTGCHIDLQGWIGTNLIGGIRKLDLPPVHLPENVQPAWEEPEIVFVPDPPVAGAPGKICVQLGNPLDGPKTVTLDFAVADFGAGIPFLPVGSQVYTLPGNSLKYYCTPWTPPTTGTLHRCVLVTLHQAGFQDEHSQRNVEIRAPASSDLSTLVIPFVAGNPDLADHVATFQARLVGVSPNWGVIVEMGDGSVLPSPFVIPGGGQVSLRLRLMLVMAASGGLAPLPPVPPLADFAFGSHSSVEVTLLLDGLPSGGFSVSLQHNRVYTPVIKQ